MAESTTAGSLTLIATRPQPLGAFPLPAGYLLVPAGEDTEEARLALLAGCVPSTWPARLRAHELALADDRDGALAALTGDDVVTRYNRFVLDPDGVDTAALRAELAEFGPLVDVVAFVHDAPRSPSRVFAARRRAARTPRALRGRAMSRLNVRLNVGGRPALTGPTSDVDVSGGWAPLVWLGAPAPGGLALPPANPTLAWMYSPRGVFLSDDLLVVADSGNHRVLIWHGVPTQDEQPADVVLGQPDGTTEGRATGGPERGMNLPTGVLVHDGKLIVADAWHHRILVWNEVPRTSDVPADLVLGQAGPGDVEPNRGGGCSASTLYWPFGIAVVGDRFWVADTGNRRVLGWDGGLPAADRPADVVLGQPDPSHREENRGGAVDAHSFRWPHAITGTGDHRVLSWRPHPDKDGPADLVLGQPDFGSAVEWPYGPHTGDRFRFPYAVGLDGDRRLAVSDTANNRILLWDGIPADGRAADHVLAQPTFASNGENRWSAVGHDTLCWPYGISLRADRLAIADSGNNRVMLWRRA